MPDTEPVFQYTSAKRFVPADKPEPDLLVADSWLVAEGYVRALRHHRNRFLSSCRQLAGIGENGTIPVWEKALELVPRTGCFFPRIELAGKPGQAIFQIRIRKAPPVCRTIRLIDCRITDSRKAPRHKGPDLQKMSAIRQNILKTGADEGILTTAKGFLLEGLTTSIMWWEGQTLCTVSPAHRVLPGITVQLVQSVAASGNIRLAYRQRKPEDLNECEVWAVNALHGIRRAVNWEQSPFKTSSHTDIDFWQKAIDRFMEKI